MASGGKVWTSLNSENKHPDFVPALASAAQISCLEIASRSARARTTWSIIKKVDSSSHILVTSLLVYRPTSYYIRAKLFVGEGKLQALLSVWRTYSLMCVSGVILREGLIVSHFTPPSYPLGALRTLLRWRPGIWSGKKLKYMHLSPLQSPFLLKITTSPEILLPVIELSEYLRLEFQTINLIILLIHADPLYFNHFSEPLRPGIDWSWCSKSLNIEIFYFISMTFLASWDNRRDFGWKFENTRIHKSLRCFFPGVLTFDISRSLGPHDT